MWARQTSWWPFSSQRENDLITLTRKSSCMAAGWLVTQAMRIARGYCMALSIRFANRMARKYFLSSSAKLQRRFRLYSGHPHATITNVSLAGRINTMLRQKTPSKRSSRTRRPLPPSPSPRPHCVLAFRGAFTTLARQSQSIN